MTTEHVSVPREDILELIDLIDIDDRHEAKKRLNAMLLHVTTNALVTLTNKQRIKLIADLKNAGGELAVDLVSKLQVMRGGIAITTPAILSRATPSESDLAIHMDRDAWRASMIGLCQGAMSDVGTPDKAADTAERCASELAAILTEPAEVSEELTPLSFVTEMWPPDQGGMRSYMPRGVKVTHKPTGITVTCEHERSQHKNRDTAIRALRAALKEPGQ